MINIVNISAELEDLIPNFLKNRTIEINSLKEAVIEENFDSIKFLGHSLKGTSGSYGFEHMSMLANKIELAALEKSIAEINEILLELEQYFNNIEIIYVEE